jgi:hypothetical protein
MELSELFTRGTPAAEVPADFRGMPGAEWQAKQLAAQSNTKRALDFYRRTLPDGEPGRRDFNTQQGYDDFVARYPGKTAPLCDRKITTPRDEYGTKGLRGH